VSVESGRTGTAAAAPEPTPVELSVRDSTLLRAAFASFATGVTVLTVGEPSPWGMTASSFTSLSLDPPLVLACVDRGARMHDRLVSATSFGVSVLAAHQEHVARHFANRWRPQGLAGFELVPYVTGRRTGVPLIRDALAWFECEVWRTYDGGDHSIFVGQLLSAARSSGTGGDGLVFHGGRFHQVPPEAS
jgi:flavin reductase